MGNSTSKDPRLGQLYTISDIHPSEKARLARLLKDPVKETFVVGLGVLPVFELPRLTDEGFSDYGTYSMSLRGRDEALMRAYYNKFLDTWGAYCWLVNDLSQLANGEWCVTLGMTDDTAAFILGRPVVPPKPMNPDADEEEETGLQNVRI